MDRVAWQATVLESDLTERIEFSSVAQSCQLFVTSWITARLKLMSIESVMPSSHLILCCPFFSCPQSLPASESFPMSQFFSWGGQSTGVSAIASFLPKNTQGWSPSEWTGWISLQSKGLSRVFYNTTVQKHQFFSDQLSSQSNFHIHTWPLEKSQPWLDRLCWQSNVSAFEYAV